jgi:hypothetical protein
MSLAITYLLGISLTGIVLLSILAIMAFINVEALQLGKNNYDAGISLVYSIIVKYF